MSKVSKPIPLTILLSISVAITVTATVAAASTGALNFFGIGPIDNEPIINGTIINNDNKTFGILIVPSGNVTAPPIPPVVNDTVPPIINDTIPPVVNDTQPPVDNDTIPIPIPEPVGQPIKVIMVGDIEDDPTGNAVFNQIKSRNADIVSVLGDLGYESDLSWFKSTYGTLGNKLNCVVGNHEAANEDGSSALEKETIQYCADSFYTKKIGKVLFLGLNTNGNLNVQLGAVQNLVMDTEFMKNITSVHVMTHKPCKTPPNSHHPASEDPDVVTLCNNIKAKIPSGVQVFFDSGHNHVLSSSADNVYKQSGAGGKSHYTCGTNAEFNFCNNVKFGFLEYTIKPDGTTTHQFIDSNGAIIK